MGCDIHMYVEYKRSLPVEGSKERKEVWVSGDYFKVNPYKHFQGEEEFERIELYGDRNYGLFSTLAGVRDYTDLIIPVSEPKGFPDDCCELVNKEKENWVGDGHTHSWLTLKELKDYQKTSPTLPRTGLLSPSDLIEFDQNGKHPDSWCQGTNQEGYERREWVVENKTLDPLIELLEARAKELLQYPWQDYDIENDNKVRIVFWFDN